MGLTRKITFEAFDAYAQNQHVGYLIEEADRWWLVVTRNLDAPGYRYASQTETPAWGLDLFDDTVLRDYRSALAEARRLGEKSGRPESFAVLNLADYFGRPGRRTRPGSRVALSWPYVPDEEDHR